MKQLKTLAALALTALLAATFSGCLYIRIGDGKTVTGSGNVKEQEVELKQDITGIVNDGSIDVVIDPSLDGKAVIEGDDNLIGYVELSQSGDGVLTVRYQAGFSISFAKQMRVRVPAMSTGGRVETSGSGDIVMAGGTLTGDSFDVRVSGSGDIALALEADNVSLSIGGSGTIKAAGKANRADVSVEGSGDVDASSLEAGDADVEIDGSGDVNVTVNGALTGSINGSGDLFYGGGPSSVKVHVSGSGDVHER